MNYYCTWSAQNYIYGCGDPGFRPEEAEGSRGAMHARASMNLESLLGPTGWARRFHPAARGGLYFLLDDGWDVPDPVDSDWFGSLIPDAGRFPGCPKEPWERLAWLNDQLKEAGWRGLGLWIAAQEAPALRVQADDEAAQKRYWTERMEWNERAGVEYWKVDWGTHNQDVAFRKKLTQWAREHAPHLTIEHAVCQGPVNDEDGRLRTDLLAKEAELLMDADVLRTYDVLQPLSPTQTLERVSALLKAMEGRKPRGRALINCEDECVLAAALGLCAGVMRHPLRGLRCGGDPDPFFPRMIDDAKLRMDEVARMVNWQAVMPPFGATEEPVWVDARLLQDSWRFSRGETWMESAVGQEVAQCAPARVSRGIALPEVRCDGEPPFVVASCHDGCAAVATLPRTRRVRTQPLADVELRLPRGVSNVAVFGAYRSLRITGLDGEAVCARDLLGGETTQIPCTGGELTLSGEQIDAIGLSCATPGDLSAPGLIMTIVGG